MSSKSDSLDNVPRTVEDAKRSGEIVGIARHGQSFLPQFSNLSEIVEFSKLMSAAGVMVGKACRGNPGACMAVTMLAGRYNLDPFLLSSKAYVVKDRSGTETLAWESQAINAMIIGSGVLDEPLRYDYHGDGLDRYVEVTGRLRGHKSAVSLKTPPIRAIETQNSPLWRSDPDQQLAYYGSRAWCRRYAAHVLMGVYTPEEAAQFDGGTPVPAAPPVLSAGFADQDDDSITDAEIIDDSANGQEAPQEPEDAQEPSPAPNPPPDAPEAAHDDDGASPEPEPEAAAPAEAKATTGDFHADLQAFRDTRLDGVEDYPQILEFWRQLHTFRTWPELKGALNDLALTDDWRRAAQVPGQSIISGIRAATFHQAQLVAVQADATDPVYFRCYVEAADGHAELAEVFETYKQSTRWKSLKDHQRAILTGAVERRTKELINGR